MAYPDQQAVSVGRGGHVGPRERRRLRSAQPALKQQAGDRGVYGAAPLRLGRRLHAALAASRDRGRGDDGRHVLDGERFGLSTALAGSLPPEPFERLPYALVVGGVGERMVAVGCRDPCAGGVERGGRGALRDAIGEVGGDGGGAGRKRLVPMGFGPCLPRPPRRAVRPAGVVGAGLLQRLGDASGVRLSQLAQRYGRRRSFCPEVRRSELEQGIGMLLRSSAVGTEGVLDMGLGLRHEIPPETWAAGGRLTLSPIM